jgi:hypothetical protein
MKNRKWNSKKIVKYFLISLSAAAILLFALRSVYAISLFQSLSGTMVGSGWQNVETDSVMQVDEEVTFEAGYLFFKIGAVKFQVLGKTVYDSVSAYRFRAYIDSYSGIPFVNLHAVFETIADARTLTCLFTSNSQKEGDNWIYTSYHFNFDRNFVEWRQSENGKVIKEIDYPLDKGYTDGLSFFYYLREANRRANGKMTSLSIPIVLDTIRSSVDLTINEKKENCDVSAYDFPLESNRMSGHLNFKGFFGVTGDFVGWMSADSAEVPLRANVKVILGSVVVKLKGIKRENWIPPRGSEQ